MKAGVSLLQAFHQPVLAPCLQVTSLSKSLLWFVTIFTVPFRPVVIFISSQYKSLELPLQ